MMTSDDRDDHIGRTLRALGDHLPEAPPPPPALQAEIDRLTPVRTRQPRRQFVAISAISLLYGGLLLLIKNLRPDLSALPTTWLVLYGAAWLASFLAITWLVLVPGPRRVMPSWRRAGIGAIAASAGFVLAGLLLDRHAPGHSVVLEPTLGGFLRGTRCLLFGGVTALVPVALSTLLLRGSVPVGAHWAGAGVGAAGASLGGLMLHFHCPVADPLHLGLVHGGLVVLGAVLGALAVPRIARA
jgi:hypothetical protein